MKQQTMSRWHSKSRMLRTAALSLLVATAVVLAVAGCGDGAESSAEDEQASSDGPRATVTIAAAPWSSAEAGANLVKVVLEEHLDYRVSIRYMPADEMWETVASGEADATVSAWLPVTHAAYAEEYGNDVVDLGANVEGVQTGLVVPRVSVGRQTDATGTRVQPYIPATSIAELGEYAEGFGGRIVGIEPTAGIMQRAREALEVYDLEGDFRLVEGSEEDMITALERAVRNQTWVVVTGWTPHWAFGQWELEFLDDPENVFGSDEEIHTVVSSGLQEAHPEVYTVLERFRWSLDDIEQVMLWIHRDGGSDPYAKARRWVRTHPEQVESWLPDGEGGE